MSARSFPICLSISLLLVTSLVTVFSKHHSPRQLPPILPQSLRAQLAGRHMSQPANHPKPDHNLLFDSVLVYATYFGGASSTSSPDLTTQSASVVMSDLAGNLYVGGFTNSRTVAENTKQRIWKPRVYQEFERLKATAVPASNGGNR